MKMLQVILGIVVLSTTLVQVTSFKSTSLPTTADNQFLTTPLFHTSPIASSSASSIPLAAIAPIPKKKSPQDGASNAQAITTTETLDRPTLTITASNSQHADPSIISRTKRSSSVNSWSKSEKQNGGGSNDGQPRSDDIDEQLRLSDAEGRQLFPEVIAGRSGSPASVSALYNMPDDVLTSAAMRLAAMAEKRGGQALNGFVGMRGKKDDGSNMQSSYDGGDGVKRAKLKDGFLGMRGKKNPASSAFYGMRGKKGDTEDQSHEDDVITYGSDVNDKRVATSAVYGMRGKKRVTSLDDVNNDEEEWRQNFVDEMAAIKRKPANAFLGMRGKKGKMDATDKEEASSSKRQISNAFLGMRGKKSDEEEENSSNDAVKRGGGGGLNKGFIGMRGKKMRISDAASAVKYAISSPFGRGRDVSGLAGDGHHAPHIRDVRQLYRTFMESATVGDRPRTYADRKRQIGNIFIGMRG